MKKAKQILFEAEVRDLISDGRGVISTPEGVTCFVPGVWPGEKAVFKLGPKKGAIQEAEVSELLISSKHRRTAPCQYHGHSSQHCGGCPWQFIDYDAQREEKQKRLHKAIERIAPKASILPIIAAPAEMGYRNRAQLKTDGKKIGFEASRSNQLVGIKDCIILTEKNRQTLAGLITQLPNKEWQAPKPRHKRKPSWSTLHINESINAEGVTLNQRLPFLQGNSAQNEVMKNWLAEQLATIKTEGMVLELFCGSGNFTQVIAQSNASQILATEIDPQAVAALNHLGLNKTQAIACNLFDEEQLPQLARQAKATQVLVLDPPRDGFKALPLLCKPLKKLNTIFYISCNLATFARDVSNLSALGFILKEVQAIDLFPQTPHVELMAKLTKK